MIDISCNVPESLQEINAEVSIASDYSLLQNKPGINGVTLVGNKSLAELGIPVYNWELISTADFTETPVDTVVFSTDSTGSPFSLKSYRLVVELLETNGNRWHVLSTGMSRADYCYYYNSASASASALYRSGGQQVIIEPLFGFDNILDIKNTTPPPLCLYAQSTVPQWIQFYTYNGALEKSKSDFFPVYDVTIELQNAVHGIIYLYGARV